MNISLFGTSNWVNQDAVKDKICIVLDVLRATSVMITALSNGARYIIPILEVDEARLIKKISPDVLIGGEREGIKIEGFDLDNSPFSYSKEKVYNKVIVMTTTNGTRALIKAKHAKRTFIASFINAKYTIDYIIEYYGEDDISIICAGTDDKFSLEDFLCAGFLIELIKGKCDHVEMDDFSYVAYNFYKNNASDINKVLAKSFHYSRLRNIGFENDLSYCLQFNTHDCVCIFKENMVKRVD